MARLPVPDDYEKVYVSIAGTADYHYGEADVNTDAVDHARDVRVAEDDDGRYVGVSDHYAADVADFLGVEYEGEPEPDDADTCQTVKSDGEVCGRELPCPYHSDG